MTAKEKRLAAAKAKHEKLRIKLAAIYKMQQEKTRRMQQQFSAEYYPVERALLEAKKNVSRAELAMHGITPMHTIVKFDRFYETRFTFCISERGGWFEMLRVRKDNRPCQMSEKWRCATPHKLKGLHIMDEVLIVGDE